MKESKYTKGEIVYGANNTYDDKTRPCPDCLGDKEWTIVFPSGQVTEIGCMTCRASSFYEPSGKVHYKSWKKGTRELTIGSVRYDDSNNEPFSYMCEETGIGSGRIYYENELFVTEDEAMEFAEKDFVEKKKRVAVNKFKSRKDIEQLLSTYGYTRSLAPKVVDEFKQWVDLLKKHNHK